MQDTLQEQLKKELKPFGKILSSRRLNGGDINTLTLLHCAQGDVVVKSGNNLTGMYEAEAKGLELLKQQGLPVPEVLAYDQNFLLMQALSSGSPHPAEAGRLLAQMHMKKQNFFGLQHHNFIGNLPQKNICSNDWISFYRDFRLGFQWNLLLQKKIVTREHNRLWQNFFEQLDLLLPHRPQASLLHGDLWSGNLFWAKQGAVFIDPAVYYGDRYVDIAFSELFGGFGHEFYTAYNEVFALDSEYRELKALYQIYPLLVHANLFGGHYYNSAFSLMQKYKK